MAGLRILVAQMTRMGDVLQTTPLVRALRKKYPDAHIAIMIRQMGKTIAERVPDLDEILIYDEDEMYLHCVSGDSDRYLNAYRKAEEYIAQLSGAYDVVYNCTHSVASAMLLRLSGIPKVVGAHISDEWDFLLRGRWTNYFFTSVMHREFNSLNLCDVMGRFSESPEPCQELVLEVRGEDRAWRDNYLQERSIKEKDFVVFMQLGASEEQKRWLPESFAALAKSLQEKNGARLFLVGVAGEAPLGEAFEVAAPGIAEHLFGKTSIAQLAALLERADVLITNDTGTMHIAAAVKCSVMLVSVGTVHFRETGPFGTGHMAIERRKVSIGRVDSDREDAELKARIRPDQVALALSVLLEQRGKEQILQLEPCDQLEGVELHTSRFAPDGCLEWYPVVRRAIVEADFLRIAYRSMWLKHLDALPNKGAGEEAIRLALGYWVSPEPAAVREWETRHVADFSGLAALAEQGVLMTEQLIQLLEGGGSMTEAKEIVTTLMGLDQDMRLYGDVREACKPLVLISRYERDNLEGDDPRVLARTTLAIYHDCAERARLMQEMLTTVARVWHEKTRDDS